MILPEPAVPNTFIGGSFWNNSAFPSSTDPLHLHNTMALCRCYSTTRLVVWGMEAVALAAAVGPGLVYS